MKKVKKVLFTLMVLMFFSVAVYGQGGMEPEYKTFYVDSIGIDTTYQFPFYAYGSDNHAVIIMFDSVSGSSYTLGTNPTYTIQYRCVMPIKYATSGRSDSLYFGETSTSWVSITSNWHSVDTSRVFAFTPTAEPCAYIEVKVYVKDMNPKEHWRGQLTYVGRFGKREDE